MFLVTVISLWSRSSCTSLSGIPASNRIVAYPCRSWCAVISCPIISQFFNHCFLYCVLWAFHHRLWKKHIRSFHPVSNWQEYLEELHYGFRLLFLCYLSVPNRRACFRVLLCNSTPWFPWPISPMEQCGLSVQEILFLCPYIRQFITERGQRYLLIHT